MKHFALVLSALFLLSCGDSSLPEKKSLDQFEKKALLFGSTVTPPPFPRSPREMDQESKKFFVDIEQRRKHLTAIKTKDINYKNTVMAFDRLQGDIINYRARLYAWTLVADNPAIKKKAAELLTPVSILLTQVQMDANILSQLHIVAAQNTNLSKAQNRLLKYHLRMFRRNGFRPGVSASEIQNVAQLKMLIAKNEMEFSKNIMQIQNYLDFESKKDLEGVPESFLNLHKKEVKGKTLYRFNLALREQVDTLLKNAKSEAIRKKIFLAHFASHQEKNEAILKDTLLKRDQLGKLLGYTSWAEYQIELKMLKTPQKVFDFFKQVENNTQKSFQEEKKLLTHLKRKDTQDEKATLHIWDVDYYMEKYSKQIFGEQKERRFPLKRALSVLFKTYSEILGVKFYRIPPPYKWTKNMQLYGVSDAKTDRTLGLIFLAFYHRKGKYTHLISFPLRYGFRR